MDQKIVRNIVGEFSQLSRKYYNNYAYSTGYLESIVVRLLNTVPPSECMSILNQFEKEIKLLKNNTVP